MTGVGTSATNKKAKNMLPLQSNDCCTNDNTETQKKHAFDVS